jgi:hypothetical protein
MRTRNRMTRPDLDYWKAGGKKIARLLYAKSDKDPDALLVEITPVDLSDATPCPLCGCNTPNPKGETPCQ